MKKVLNVLFVLLCLAACQNKDNSQKNENQDEYYVKYLYQAQFLVNNNPQSMPDGYTFTYTDYDLSQHEVTSITSTKKIDLVCGPFKYNDKISASIQYETIENNYKRVWGDYWEKQLQTTYGYSSFDYMTSIEIYVSKNNSPFVQRELVNGEYVINF